MSSTELGTFLKARRGHVLPTDVGITAQSGRRVSGLRREEVAMLAGVSVDYYTRLEQGRERNPSPAVLNALAGALDLDTDLREHLFRLAGLAPTPRTPPVRKTVDDSLRQLLASWSHTPPRSSSTVSWMFLHTTISLERCTADSNASTTLREWSFSTLRTQLLHRPGPRHHLLCREPSTRSRPHGFGRRCPCSRSPGTRCKRRVSRTVEPARRSRKNTRGQRISSSCRR